MNENVTKSGTQTTEVPEAQEAATIDKIYVLIGHYLVFVVSTPLAGFGIWANLANMFIFSRQGRRECVSICLFSLAVSDFCCCITVLIFDIVYIMNFLEDFTIIEPVALDVVMSYLSAMFYDVSQGITAFISLQRCLCVAMPLKFKDIFNVNRSIAIMIALYVLTCLAYTPHFVTCGLYTKSIPGTNSTITAMWQSSDRGEKIHYLNYILHIGVETFYQCVVVISAIVMIIGLKRSSRFRQAESSHKYTNSEASVTCSTVEDTLSRMENESNDNENFAKTSKTVEKQNPIKQNPVSSSKGVTDKNRNVVVTVMALAVLAIICNMERLIAVYGQRFVHGFTFDGIYRNFFFLVVRVTFLFGVVNSSLNFFIYFTFNHTYRRTFFKIFCSWRKEDQM